MPRRLYRAEWPEDRMETILPCFRRAYLFPGQE